MKRPPGSGFRAAGIEERVRLALVFGFGGCLSGRDLSGGPCDIGGGEDDRGGVELT